LTFYKESIISLNLEFQQNNKFPNIEPINEDIIGYILSFISQFSIKEAYKNSYINIVKNKTINPLVENGEVSIPRQKNVIV
jgi:hypothetical protein